MAVVDRVEELRCVELSLRFGGYSLGSLLSSSKALRAGEVSGYREHLWRPVERVLKGRQLGYWANYPRGSCGGASP